MSGCTHPLLLDLNLKPSTRRSNKSRMTCLFFTQHRQNVLAELNASRQQLIVSDIVWTGLTAEEAEETNPDDPLALPRESSRTNSLWCIRGPSRWLSAPAGTWCIARPEPASRF